MFAYVAILLAAAVLFVPLFKRLGLGSVLGYLAAGVAIGPAGFGAVEDVQSMLRFSEFGVVLLLFIIGLELQPSRLWALRRAVFGAGGAQVLVTGAILAVIASRFGLSAQAAIIAGLSLALSSTAFVIQMLAERRELTTQHGRRAFAILLFQDLAVIPLLALIPMLAVDSAGMAEFSVLGAARAVAALLLVALGGRYLLRPLLRLLAAVDVAEIFTAAALLLVIATALVMDSVGLSMSLGAFLAGVLLADSEYRHELQADIEPFKGLLLGLFFMAVGMSTDVQRVVEQPLQIAVLVAGLIAIKACVIYFIGRANHLRHPDALALGAAMGQGGEFAFVLFGVAVSAGLMSHEVEQLLVVVVTVSMVVTPALYSLQARLQRGESDAPPFDEIDAPPTPVIIAGFGASGQIVARILRVRRIAFTVLEKNGQHVDFVRRFGSPVFYSDATRIEVLRAAHADKAKLLVIAIPDAKTSVRIAETVHRHFPKLKVMALSRDRQHSLMLMQTGIEYVQRRTLLSSLEVGRRALLELGDSEERATHTVEVFRKHDEELLRRQLALFGDDEKMLQSARDSARELEELFESDRRQN